jgi:hypothetical protein
MLACEACLGLCGRPPLECTPKLSLMYYSMVFMMFGNVAPVFTDVGVALVPQVVLLRLALTSKRQRHHVWLSQCVTKMIA